jgi:hypothetical protein
MLPALCRSTLHVSIHCTSFHLPQVRRAGAREPRQDREGSSAKRCHTSLRVAWGNHSPPIL